MTVWQEAEELFDQYDGDLKLDVASQCCWGGQLRLTLTNPPNSPSRSMVFYSAGGIGPTDVTRKLLDDVKDWLESSDVKPLSPEDDSMPSQN